MSMNTGGKEITIETGKLAKQADGSVVVRMGDTMVLATVVSATEAKEGTDFLPLTEITAKNLLPVVVFPETFSVEKLNQRIMKF